MVVRIQFCPVELQLRRDFFVNKKFIIKLYMGIDKYV
nr:MAG: hypothetical protein [Bacteriophage sp.]